MRECYPVQRSYTPQFTSIFSVGLKAKRTEFNFSLDFTYNNG